LRGDVSSLLHGVAFDAAALVVRAVGFQVAVEEPLGLVASQALGGVAVIEDRRFRKEHAVPVPVEGAVPGPPAEPVEVPDAHIAVSRRTSTATEMTLFSPVE
jgi:hypothetical protein